MFSTGPFIQVLLRRLDSDLEADGVDGIGEGTQGSPSGLVRNGALDESTVRGARRIGAFGDLAPSRIFSKIPIMGPAC